MYQTTHSHTVTSKYHEAQQHRTPPSPLQAFTNWRSVKIRTLKHWLSAPQWSALGRLLGHNPTWLWLPTWWWSCVKQRYCVPADQMCRVSQISVDDVHVPDFSVLAESLAHVSQIWKAGFRNSWYWSLYTDACIEPKMLSIDCSVAESGTALHKSDAKFQRHENRWVMKT
jgi:hypothetical protein